MEEKYKLTISILASNRKDTLPKCLESIRPLLDKVASELIVTDTGCEEDLIELIKMYTEKIVKFDWCNDFSKARNVGLEFAKGQWFMFIDDDEWFENVDEIIEFFNSGEYKEYDSAGYLVRNYTNMCGDRWNDGVVERLFRIYPGIKFEGKIHEHIYRECGMYKQFFSYVHHYGYVFENEEKKKEHYDRNTMLLIQQIEEEPTKARYYAHIYQQFRARNEYDKSWEYTLKALENVDISKKENLGTMCSTYVNAVWVLMQQKKYTEAITYGQEFLKERPLTGLATAAIVGYLAEAEMRCHSYEKCIDFVDKYLTIKNKYKQNKEYYYSEIGPMLKDTFYNSRVDSVISSGLFAAIEIGDERKVYEYILGFDWSHEVCLVDEACIDKIIYLPRDKKLFKQSVRAFGMLFTHVKYGNIILKNMKKLSAMDMERYIYLLEIISNVAGQSGYNNLVKLIIAYKNSDRQALMKLYKLIVESENALLSMEKEFFNIAIEVNIPLGELICTIDEVRWQKMLDLWAINASNKDIITVKNYMDKMLPKDSIHIKMFEIRVLDMLESRKRVV